MILVNANTNKNEAGSLSCFTPTKYIRSNGRIHMGYVADAQGQDEGTEELRQLIREMMERDKNGKL